MVATMRQSGGAVTFYVLIATQTLSWVGSRTSSLAVGIAVFKLTGHATPIALVTVFLGAPTLVLGGFAGALADRVDRRSLTLAANLGYASRAGFCSLPLSPAHSVFGSSTR
jgi:hypothetical protein